MKYIKLKDKRGLSLKSGAFAIVIFSVAMIATGVWVDEWGQAYDSGLTSDFDDFNVLDEMSNEAELYRGNLSTESSSEGQDFEGTTIRAVFGIVNTVFRPFQLVFGNNGMIDNLTERFGMPDWIRQTFVTLIVLAIVWAIVTILFGRSITKSV